MKDTTKVESQKSKVESKKPGAVTQKVKAVSRPMSDVSHLDENVMHKIFTGKVISIKRTNTVGVSIPRLVNHAKYGKQLRRSTTIAAHNETFALAVGDTVKVEACRPISKTKHFKVIEKI